MNLTTSLEEKADFLRNQYVPLLRTIHPSQPPMFGKLSAQGAVEHMADSLRMANGRDLYDCDATPEHIEKMHAFIRSDKPFREGTNNPLMSEMPAALRHASMDEAISDLAWELEGFFDLFAQDRTKLVTNPIFGDLDYELWVLLLYRHAWHHLKQFGAMQAETAGSN
jgi:hypothetical protein